MSVSKRTRTRTTTENNVPKNRFLEPVYIKSHVWLQNVLELIHWNVNVNQIIQKSPFLKVMFELGWTPSFFMGGLTLV